MDLLTLVETCSVADDLTLVLAMALTFSAGQPFTVRDAQSSAELPSDVSEYLPEEARATIATRDEALVELHRLLREKRTVVAGLLPATPEWAAELERPVEELLDPCAGLGIATVYVSQFEYECRRGGGRRCVLRKYARAAGLDFFDQDVLQTIRLRGLPKEGSRAVIDSEAVFNADVLFSDDPKRDWGADLVLFPAPAPAPNAAQPTAASPANAEEPRKSVPATSAGPKHTHALRVPIAPVPPLPLATPKIPSHAEL